MLIRSYYTISITSTSFHISMCSMMVRVMHCATTRRKERVELAPNFRGKLRNHRKEEEKRREDH